MTNQTQEALKMAHTTFMQLNERLPRRDNGDGYFDKEITACKEALEQPSNMVIVPLDKLEDMQRRLSDCEEYLKEDETPAECIARNRKDANTTLKLLAKCMGEKKALEQPALTDEKGKPMTYWGGLKQPAQEPVGKWESKCKCDFRTKLVGDGCRYCNTEEYIDKLHHDYDDLLEENEQLLTHPHQWQGLTDDEREILYDKAIEMPLANLWNDYAYLVEQALKDKNTCS